MNVQQAVELLHRKGYRANASPIMPGYVVVLDPAHCRRGSEPLRIEYDRRVIHASEAWRFIIERE